MFELLNACDFGELIFSLVNVSIRPVARDSIFSLVEYLQTSNLLVNSLHKLSQALEVKFELLDQLFAIILEGRIE